jgi:hypothetical protein
VRLVSGQHDGSTGGPAADAVRQYLLLSCRIVSADGAPAAEVAVPVRVVIMAVGCVEAVAIHTAPTNDSHEGFGLVDVCPTLARRRRCC